MENALIEERIDEIVDKMVEKQKKSSVTMLERSVKTFSFQEPDRLIKGLSFFSPKCLGINKITTREYYTDIMKMYYCQAIAIAEWENEIPLMYGDAYNIEIEAMGGKIIFPEHSSPIIKELIIERPSDLLKLKVPDPYKDGRMPSILELNRLHQRKLGKIVFAPASCTGPFSLAVSLRGYENIIQDIKKDPLFVHDLLEFCCAVVVNYGRALLSVNNASPTLQEAWSCLPNISPNIFYEFSLPYVSRCMESLRNPESGLSGTLFYGWGTSLAPDWQALLRTICAMGISALPITEEEIMGFKGYKKLDLEIFKKITSARKVVLLSFLHIDSISYKTPEQINEIVKRWFYLAGKDGGFVISATLPNDAPKENIKAYLSAIEECRYPFNEENFKH